MTIASTQRTAQYNGNGTTTAFSTQFVFNTQPDVQVYKKLAAATTWNLLNFGTDYQLTGGATALGVAAAGVVTCTVAPSALEQLLISRTVAVKQGLTLNANDGFPAKSVEQELDYLTMIAQQLSDGIAGLTSVIGTSYLPTEPYVLTNNAILALLQNITQNAAIPVGYNALAIQPTISAGVVVTVPAGSVFLTMDSSLGVGPGGGPYATLVANTFTGAQTIGSGFSFTLDPAFGRGYINRSNNLPVDPTTLENNGWAADITVSSGTGTIAPIRGLALSKTTHSGFTIGVECQTRNFTDKSGAGLGALLLGFYNFTMNEMFTHTAPVNAGGYFVFGNRPVGQANPTNTGVSGANSHNRGYYAQVYDSQGRGANAAIPCGWNKGIHFTQSALDLSGVSPQTKAVGIDFTAISHATTAPEGGTYAQRVQSFIAFPTGYSTAGQFAPAMSFSDDKTSCQMNYGAIIGDLQLRFNGSLRFAFVTNGPPAFSGSLAAGLMYMMRHDDQNYSYWLNLAGFGSIDVMLSFRTPSGGLFDDMSAAPANTATPAGWVKVRRNGSDFRIPLYQ